MIVNEIATSEKESVASFISLIRDYQAKDRCRTLGMDFQPLVVNNVGEMNAALVTLLEFIGESRAKRMPLSAASTIQNVKRRFRYKMVSAIQNAIANKLIQFALERGDGREVLGYGW